MSEQVQTRIDQLPDCRPSSPAEAFEWLGDTVEEVAEGLRARGIKGGTNRPRACPIHNYLAVWGWDVGITPNYLLDGPVNTTNYQPTPPPVSAFIWSFDSGAFPDLIAD